VNLNGMTSNNRPRFAGVTLLMATVILLPACAQGDSLLATTTSTTSYSPNSKTPNATSASTNRAPASSSGLPLPADTNIKPASASNISLDIELPPILETVENLEFKVKPNVAPETIPANTQWQWDFGDGTPLDTKVGRTEPFLSTGHRYAKNGDYQVKVSLVDLTTRKALATATKAFVVSDIVSIRKVNHMQLILKLTGATTVRDSKDVWESEQEYLRTFNEELFRKQPWTFEWTNEWRSGSAGRWGGDEIKFKGTYRTVINTETGEQTKEYSVTGKITVSPEGIKLVDYSSVSGLRNPNYKGSPAGWFVDTTVDLKPIPVTKISGGDAPKFQTRIQGYESVWGYLIDAGYRETLPNGKSNDWQPSHYPDVPGSELQIVFDKLKNAE
jgi:hypothetical protein